MLPQSDGQAESQYAAARQATQDRFGFYQVPSFSYISTKFWWWCRWIIVLVSVEWGVTNSLSQGSDPKWTDAFSTTGGASWWQGLLRWDANSEGGKIHLKWTLILHQRLIKKNSVEIKKMFHIRMLPRLPSVMPSLPQRSTRRWPNFLLLCILFLLR